MKSKRIFLPRRMIGLLGNPTHLSFWYDEENGNLLISPHQRMIWMRMKFRRLIGLGQKTPARWRASRFSRPAISAWLEG